MQRLRTHTTLQVRYYGQIKKQEYVKKNYKKPVFSTKPEEFPRKKFYDALKQRESQDMTSEVYQAVLALRAQNYDDVYSDSAPIFDTMHEEAAELKQKHNAEEAQKTGLPPKLDPEDEEEQRYRPQSSKFPMERFSQQFGMNAEVEGKVNQTLHKFSQIRPVPFGVVINKKPMPDYYTDADRKFEEYTKRPGANFVRLPDVPNMKYSEMMKNVDQVSDEVESNLVESETDVLMTDDQWHEKAIALKPGDVQEEVNPAFSFLFSKQAPAQITVEEASKLYLVSNSDYHTYFASGVGDIDPVWKTLHQRGVMIRPAVLPVIDFLAKFDKGIHDRLGYIFTGTRGAGKSFLLLQAVHHAFKKDDTLVFYIPNLRFWTNGNHFVLPSPLLRGYFDCQLPQYQFMKAFRRGNSHILKTMKLHSDYKLPIPEEWGQAKLVSLDDLMAWSCQNDQTATIGFKILLDELHLDKTQKMVFAIDDYNYSLGNTGFHFGNIENYQTEKPKRVHARQLVLIRGLERIMANRGLNKVFLAATSEKHVTETKWHLDHFNSLTAINVQRYTFSEITNICSYYMSAHYVYGVPEAYLEDLVWVTGGNPGRVWKQMALF